MTYLQAVVIALVQGVTELFPVSSLGHSVLLPAWLGGSWQTLVTQSSQAEQRELVLPGLHRGAALRDGAGAHVVLPRRLGQDHPGLLPQPARQRPAEPGAPAAAAGRGRQGRAARLDDHLRDDPGRPDRRRARAHLPGLVRQARCRGGPAVRQRADPARRRGTAAIRGPAEAGGTRGRAGRQDLAFAPAAAQADRRGRPREPQLPWEPPRPRVSRQPPLRRTPARPRGGSRHRTASPPAGGRSPTSTPRSSRTLASRGFPTRTAS